ncbi:MAG: dihydroorotase family protein [Pseudomonadota bacterium]
MEMSRITGNIVFSDGVHPAVILMEDGVIEEISEADESFPDTELIFPGFIDIHVHAREYPKPHGSDAEALKTWEAFCRKETFATAGRAALRGGVTLFAAMPNDPVPPDNADSYALKESLTHSSACPVILLAAVTPRSEPWDDLPYKVYLDAKPSPVSFTSWRDLETVLSRYRGCRVFFHAEDPEILARNGSSGPRWKTRPADAEIRAVDRLLDLTLKFDLRSHICHVSTEGAVELIDEYNRHVREIVTCEVTPHHLYFSVEDGDILCAGKRNSPVANLLDCNPPLRSEDDRRALVDSFKQGYVHILATDHAPHTLEDKARGAPGMPHLDTVGSFVSWLVRDCGVPPYRIAEAFAVMPGWIMNPFLDVPVGDIDVGYEANFTVLDLSDSTLVEGSQIKGRGPLETRCGWSPFEGIRLPGAVKQTVVRGRALLSSGEGDRGS